MATNTQVIVFIDPEVSGKWLRTEPLTKGQHHVLSTYSGVAAGTLMNRHMAGLSTDGTGTGEGRGGGCCRGEGAQAEVTDWNNGADERQESCLCFREGNYWARGSPGLSDWITGRRGGRRRQKGGTERQKSADRRHKATPTHQWMANCSKVWPAQWGTDILCLCVVCKCVHHCRLVGMCVWFDLND